jgi:3-oxoacid CoA-transferase
MINKIVQTMADAMVGIRDGAIILLGGFGNIGQPHALLDGLIEQGARDLTVVSNNAGVGRTGLARLLDLGRVRKIICSYPRTADPVVFEELYRAGKIELEIVPQGTMAERIRAAGAGIPAFYTATAVGTKLAAGKEEREIRGRKYLLEESLHGDVALVEAWEADRWGNLTYRSSGQNFNPIMASAAKLTIVQTQHVVELGALDPEKVMTPGIYVNRVVHVPYGDPMVPYIFVCAEEQHMSLFAACKPLSRNEMAERLARDIPEGWYVNLGIGAPLKVADYVPMEREVIFQSENGVLGMGPAPAPDKVDRWLINAGKQYVTLRAGGSYMHHADSFALIRGGHLDLCVLGAFQVAENGDIANWSMSDNDSAPAVGGAMDLAAGARELWVVMEHQTKSGDSRLVRRCSYPLTAIGAVTRVYTNLAVLDVTPDGFAVREMVPGLTLEALQQVTDAPLRTAAKNS